MNSEHESKYLVAVIGAGPAGLYASRQLAEDGAHVVIFNRDIKPGGLAEYGIYPEKLKMKDGLRRQFAKILELPNVTYFGHVTVGNRAFISGNCVVHQFVRIGTLAIMQGGSSISQDLPPAIPNTASPVRAP